jgi:tRNA 2-selenouridine synthase
MALRPEQLFPAGACVPPWSLIDVRSPVEVARGALPHARSLPLMSDEERHLVGIRYKEAGQEAAIALGYELAGPHLPARTEAWRAACADGPAAVTCWRGGLRSRLAVEMIGRPDVEAVEGGYKAVRAHLLASLPLALARARVVVLTGLTGTGKTELLRSLALRPDALEPVDLEGLARHRGSAFGALDEAQPPQATFENALAAQLLLTPARLLLVEDESRHVGRRTLPTPLVEAMAAAPVAVLERPLADRVERVFDEYVRAPSEREGAAAVRLRLEGAARRLRARLGGRRVEAVLGALAEAGRAWDEIDAHRPWIELLLREHYDPLYAKAIARNERRVLVRGDAAALREALLELASA